MEEITASVKDTWNPSVVDINVDELLTRFNTEYDHHFHNINGKYEMDQALVERCQRNINTEFDPKQVVDTLSDVISYYEKKLALLQIQEYLIEIFGEDYREAETDLNKIENIIQDSTNIYGVKALVYDAMRYSEAIISIEKEIAVQWELSVLEIDTDSMLARFKIEYIGAFHRLKPAYKEDIRTLRLYYKSIGTKIDEKAVIELLIKAKQFRETKKWFEDHYNTLFSVFKDTSPVSKFLESKFT